MTSDRLFIHTSTKDMAHMVHSTADGKLLRYERLPAKRGASIVDLRKFQAALATADAERAEHARLRFWDHHGRWLVPLMFAGAVAFWLTVFAGAMKLMGWL